MKIKLTSVYVDDQEKALRFYTEVLGFVKKADFSQGPFRWLTVASPEDPDGTELQLALNDKPAAKAYQQAMLQQATNRGDRLQNRNGERHLRQCHSDHAADALAGMIRPWEVAQPWAALTKTDPSALTIYRLLAE